ncbi:MAG: transposase, partial [Nitrososphaerales archaeon]
SEVERMNTFIVEGCPTLKGLADNCARLYNEVNLAQAGVYTLKFPWYPEHLYEKYAPSIGSATAQQIINKNSEAWRSFFALKRLEVKGKLPPHIAKVSMPGYWKKDGRRDLRVIIRNDCYRVDDEYLYLHLPKGLRLRYKGGLRWHGRQGRLEVVYDDAHEVWRGFMAVNVERPPIRGGNKPLYIDLGVINLAAVWFEGLKQPVAYSGRAVLADWRYWTKRIAKMQSKLARVNSAKTSRRLGKLYRIRQRRLRHAINAVIKAIVEDAYTLGISKIVLGKLKGIRKNNHNGKANSMINNFWSFGYIVRRFREKAEE